MPCALENLCVALFFQNVLANQVIMKTKYKSFSSSVLGSLIRVKSNWLFSIVGFSVLTSSFSLITQSAYGQSLNRNLPEINYCREYRQQAAASVNSSSTSGGASGWGTAGAGGGSANFRRDLFKSQEDQGKFERNCDQLLRTSGEVTIEQIRAQTQQQSIKEGATTDRYTACLQAAQYTRESRREDHLNGCQCIAQGKQPIFYGATGIFHSCKQD